MVGRQWDCPCRSISIPTLLPGEIRHGLRNLLIHWDGQYDPLGCLVGHQCHQQCPRNPRELQDLRDPQDPLDHQLHQHREEHIGIVFSKIQSLRTQVTRMMHAGRHKI